MNDWAEFRHFRYLLAILEREGFRAAAEELHTSQPNLTVQARQFQERAGVRLFRKAKSGRIRPTQTGVAFAAMARSLLQTRDEMIALLQTIERSELPLLRFGSSPLADPALYRSFCSLHRELVPSCVIRPAHGDTPHLAQEILSGEIDAAIVTLPIEEPLLTIEVVRRDRLVVCMRKDDPLAVRSALRTSDLDGRISVLYHPKRHPAAHQRLLHQLSEAGIDVQDYSRASDLFELQELVKDGHGFALVREGMQIDETLTTRRISDADWNLETAIAYRSQGFPKSVPVVTRILKRTLTGAVVLAPETRREDKRPPRPVQQTLPLSEPMRRRA